MFSFITQYQLNLKNGNSGEAVWGDKHPASYDSSVFNRLSDNTDSNEASNLINPTSQSFSHVRWLAHIT
jgi:hypothetical protein